MKVVTLSDGDLDGFDESDDESASQTNIMENIIEPTCTMMIR